MIRFEKEQKEFDEKGYYTLADGTKSTDIGKKKEPEKPAAKPKYVVPDTAKPKKEIKK